MRPSTPQSLLSVKAAFRRLVTACGGPESAQHITRCKAAALSRFGGMADEQFAPADVIADLETDCGSPILTSHLAAMQGYRLVLDDAALGRDGQVSFAAVTDIFGHATRIAETVTTALEDGHIDGAEANQIIVAAEQAITRLRALQKRAQTAGSRPHGGEVADER